MKREELREHKYNNHVIEVLDSDHGDSVRSWWKSQIPKCSLVSSMGFNCTASDNDRHRYYGLIDGKFENYGMDEIENKRSEGFDITILTPELPPASKLLISDFKIGEEVGFKNMEFQSDGSARIDVSSNDFIYDSLPDKYQDRGNTTCPAQKGVVVDFFDDTYIVVQWIDDNGRQSHGGFTPSLLLKLGNSIINKQTKTKNHGNTSVKVQRPAPKITTGKRNGGSVISGRRGRTAIAVGHLSNKEVRGI